MLWMAIAIVAAKALYSGAGREAAPAWFFVSCGSFGGAIGSLRGRAALGVIAGLVIAFFIIIALLTFGERIRA